MENFEKFYNASLRFLSFRPRSEKEVRDSLKRKKAPPKIIEEIILKLKELNFINDREFAKWWIEQRLTFRLKALRVIKNELKLKGIIDEITEDVLRESQVEQKADYDIAKKLAERKVERYKGLAYKDKRLKLTRFLANKGFSFEDIEKSIDDILGKRYN
jgi:regulatory protein